MNANIWNPEDVIDYREAADVMFRILSKRKSQGDTLTFGENQFLKAFEILEKRNKVKS